MSKMIHLASASRVKNSENANNNQGMRGFTKKPEDFNNFIVMSGSATRKRFQKKDNQIEKITTRKDNFNQSFIQLRAPFCKSHQKHALNEERVMTKSCEILFECIKPYKDILMMRRTQIRGSTKTTHRILTTDIVYERKATRKVQFFTFSEDLNPEQDFLDNQDPPPSLMEAPEDSNEVGKTTIHLPIPRGQQGPTVSSEDFITNVFSEPVFI